MQEGFRRYRSVQLWQRLTCFLLSRVWKIVYGISRMENVNPRARKADPALLWQCVPVAQELMPCY